jgi:hypothetical protein
MAKKTLNEAVVRRFQKLANVGTLNEMYEMREEEGDDAMADADAMAPPEDPMTDEDPMADESAGMDVEITNEEADILIQLGEKLSGAMSGDEEEEEMPTGDFGGEEPEEDEDPEDPEAAIMEALRGISYTPSKNEVVNEVAKRVAKRLKTAKLHEAKLNRALGRK